MHLFFVMEGKLVFLEVPEDLNLAIQPLWVFRYLENEEAAIGIQGPFLIAIFCKKHFLVLLHITELD